IGGIIILYTAAGGLWAVLVTDVVQFVILTAAVFIVIPLAFHQVGGIHNFTSKAPADFFKFFNSAYSFEFFLAFLAYQTIYIGGNWAYVQRYTSVSNVKNSRKVAYLFAGLYLISPFIWMLPPMIYRVLNPGLTGLQPEGAYMMICSQVLPAGLIGLVLSGMISATASKANTTINLVAVVFANDVFKKLIRPAATEQGVINSARVFTVFFGALTIGIAMMVPRVGGIVEVVLSTASIAGGSLFAPIVWSLYSKKQNPVSVITASISGLVISLFFKIIAPGLLHITLNRVGETTLGVGLPLLILLVGEIILPVIAGIPLADRPHAVFSAEAVQLNRNSSIGQNVFGIKVIAIAIGIVGIGVLFLGALAKDGGVAMTVGAVTTCVFFPVWRSARQLQKQITV
ncbi:MAG TPA: hypothetical protein VK609_11645, partial [Mucilaginibacter sp.]|nr:hypothetical protein [Mucilaginibacter sp.]